MSLPGARNPLLIELESGDSATIVPVEHDGLVVLELVAHDADAGVLATLELTPGEARRLGAALNGAGLEAPGNARSPTENREHGNPD